MEFIFNTKITLFLCFYFCLKFNFYYYLYHINKVEKIQVNIPLNE